MLGFLWRMIVGRFGDCAHKWKIIDEINVFNGSGPGRPIATRYVLQCNGCGDLKKREIGS